MNINTFCNLSINETYSIWNEKLNSFTQCFLWIPIETGSLFIFAITCSYFLGKSRHLQSSREKSYTTWFITIIAISQALLSGIEMLFSYLTQHNGFPGAYVMVKGISIITWFICFLVHLKSLNVLNMKKRSKVMFFPFLLMLISSTIKLQYTIIQIMQKHAATLYLVVNCLEFFLSFIFFASCLYIIYSKSRNKSYIELNDKVFHQHGSDSDPKLQEIYLGKAQTSRSFFSSLLFLWVNKLLLKGFHKQIKNTDSLFILPDDLQIGVFEDNFERNLQKHANKSSYTIFKALQSTFGCFYYSLGILKFLCDVLGFSGPIILNYLVNFIENKQENSLNGYHLVLALFLTKVASFILFLHYRFQTQKVGLMFRTALITTIYKKSLNVNKISLSSYSRGQIMNFMSTDTNCVVNFCQSFHEFWSLPFQIAICLYLLYQQVGVAFLSGLSFIILLIPINKWIANKIGDLSKDLMSRKDQRVKIVNEFLNGIRTIKLNVWEAFFVNKVSNARYDELKFVKKRKYLDALCVYFWAATPVVISIITFATYISMGGNLTAAKVFTSIALFNMLISPLNAFPWVLNGLMEAWVSLKRIESFFNQPEIKDDSYYKIRKEGEISIEIKNSSFTLSLPNEDTVKEYLLKNIDLKVQKGSFVGIIGQVGSGKSLLLAAISSEISKESGDVYLLDGINGFGLVSQEAWIQQGTIRDNILFGNDFDAVFYEKVVFACALIEDFLQMPAGDKTYVGENGVTLSGGQQARVSLARAVYQNKSVYLLDSPLSAVDDHVASHIFKHCIMGLLKDKTRILVTHQTKFIRDADFVVLMEKGKISKFGHPKDILDDVCTTYLSQDVVISSTSEGDSVVKNQDDLVEDEYKLHGEISLNVYKSYWKAVGHFVALAVLMSLFLMQASKNISDWWLSFWISKESSLLKSNQSSSLNSTSSITLYYLKVYSVIGIANSLLTFARAFLFAYAGINAARVMHEKLLCAMMKKSFSFFDKTPVGRIINRFSSDVYSVDDNLPFMMNIFFANFIGLVGAIVVTCYGVPWFTLLLLPLGIIYYYTQLYYRKTSRELKRICSITLSPIYEHFSETLSGISIIRALKHSNRFIGENKMFLDSNQRANYAGLVASQWLLIRLNAIGIAMVTSVALLSVVQRHLSSIDAGLVGLAISYALSLTDRLNGLVTSLTETEKEMVSVERLTEYIDDNENEEVQDLCSNSSISSGKISFNNVFLKYRECSTNALENVTFTVNAGEKVGICGRTGAGKSSLFAALFKTAELTHGSILIDDVDISKYATNMLRSQIAIVPQKPFLFEDTIRNNLDPYGQHTPGELLYVLHKCNLLNEIIKRGGLDGQLSSAGCDLSSGQKQLFCLARALLADTKIICIDEATSNVDVSTEQLVQKTLSTAFQNSTVLTIAHRLETISNCERIFLMDAGNVKEISPSDLQTTR
ncbi:ATP-binding cassette sub-family C member 10 isoform X3 [Hydra vulgaris]|uniref:ATP-binding cassette sub-family C member 10 isoform X3 n=1 Tax=Hydra vulgaris TaxID=6087 RepID=A0ABM4CKL2_HYDVU